MPLPEKYISARNEYILVLVGLIAAIVLFICIVTQPPVISAVIGAISLSIMHVTFFYSGRINRRRRDMVST